MMNQDSTSKIKPIETIYKGYRFRSRLEARWAVFFDTVGLTWEYETEGYDIFGEWYLPDFYIKDYECFVEIKPTEEPTELYSNFRDVVGKSIILLCGSPWGYIGTWFGWDTCDSSGGSYESECIIACTSSLMIHCERVDRWLCVSQWESNNNVLESHAYNAKEYPMNWDDCKDFAIFNTRDATAKAKRARFEHGESP
jgi:hypothetical protein